MNDPQNFTFSNTSGYQERKSDLEFWSKQHQKKRKLTTHFAVILFGVLLFKLFKESFFYFAQDLVIWDLLSWRVALAYPFLGGWSGNIDSYTSLRADTTLPLQPHSHCVSPHGGLMSLSVILQQSLGKERLPEGSVWLFAYLCLQFPPSFFLWIWLANIAVFVWISSTCPPISFMFWGWRKLLCFFLSVLQP